MAEELLDLLKQLQVPDEHHIVKSIVVSIRFLAKDSRIQKLCRKLEDIQEWSSRILIVLRKYAGIVLLY